MEDVACSGDSFVHSINNSFKSNRTEKQKKSPKNPHPDTHTRKADGLPINTHTLRNVRHAA